MKCRDLDRISISKKAWIKQKKNTIDKPLVGLDTETEKGKVFVLGLHAKDSSNIYRITSIDDFIDMIQKENLDESLNFFYNLTFDTNAIIKHLPLKKLRELSYLDKTKYKGITIKIVPNKQLLFKIKSVEYIFYDLAQFYDHEKLNTVSERILGQSKEDFDVKRLSSKKYDDDKDYREELDSYLKKDCELCYLLAENIYKISSKYLKPKYFFSQASLSQQYFLENMDRDYKLPGREILQFALNAYNGGRFEVFKRGTYENVSCYDIKSAYPDETIKIPALDNGKWSISTEYDKDALISLFHGYVEGYSHISPMRDEKDGILYYPCGKKEMYFNKMEYETFMLYKFKVTIIKAHHFHSENPEYPFTFLKKFFDEKERVGSESPEYMFYKIIINGFYGKLIQLEPDKYVSDDQKDAIDFYLENGKIKFIKENYKTGLLFNPIVAQEITANTRCKLLQAAYPIQGHIIAFATDSIISTVKPNIPISNNLGDWTCKESEHKQKFTSIGCGVYFFHNKNKMKFRGFGKYYNPKDVFCDEEEDKIVIETTKVIKLKQAFRQKSVKTKYGDVEISFENINEFMLVERQASLNFDRKREWLQDFKKVKDIFEMQIDSKPYVIDYT